MRQQRPGRFARNHRSHHVANRQRLRAFLFRFALRGEGIGRFARLRNHDRQRLWGNDGVAIAELASVIHFHRNARQPLNNKLARQARMPACAARHNLHLLEGFEIRFRNIHFVQEHAACFLAHAPQHGVFNGARLLKNFLQHEVLIAALFRHDRIPQNVRNLAPHDLAVQIHQLHAAWREHGNIAIVQKDHVARMAQQGRDV